MKPNHYRQNLAKYYVNLSCKNMKLKNRIIRYLQRCVHGKSNMITTKAALNKWRELMTTEYQREYENIWVAGDSLIHNDETGVLEKMSDDPMYITLQFSSMNKENQNDNLL